MSVTGSCPPPAWRAAAACAGLKPRVVLFRKVEEAAPALRACARCPMRRHCEEAVAPADDWFDGASGGRLWRRGRPVEIPAQLLPAMQSPVVEGALRRGGSVA
ncbi:WhiB family transcriptional regulator [Streptomyces sp. NPDC005917]|uniref:WhiB family transcriptional regulator n=1 Tax=unclassified Streptomyces TaxID=2593676 RepID=UPI00340590F4